MYERAIENAGSVSRAPTCVVSLLFTELQGDRTASIGGYDEYATSTPQPVVRSAVHEALGEGHEAMDEYITPTRGVGVRWSEDVVAAS